MSGNLAESLHQDGDASYPIIDGMAVIEFSGVLIHRCGCIGESSGWTSYEDIAAQIEAAASDPFVRGLAREMNSVGGEAATVSDLAGRVRARRCEKPVSAFVTEQAFSATVRWQARHTASCCRAPGRLTASESSSCMPVSAASSTGTACA
ncbi:hypothetical protein ACROSR_12430 [Roseovarius tibetensis]|uniref:hypothetical protein n=1 Tax=Roseovarius tibetensis TaxID=2685897 RepID=UPI003D7FC480